MRRRLQLGPVQEVAQLDQVLQRGQMHRGRAFRVAAIRQELALQLGGEELQAAGEPALLLQRHGGRHGALQRHQPAAVLAMRRQGGDQPARVLRQPLHQRLAEAVLGGRGQEVPVPQPGGKPRPHHLRRIGQGLVAGAGQPVLGQRPRPQPGIVRAQRPQVAQPGEAVQRGAPAGAAAAHRLRRAGRGAGGLGGQQQAGGAEHLELALQQPLAPRRVARPEVAEGAGRRLGHAQRLEPGQGALGAAQPAAHSGLRNVSPPPPSVACGRSAAMAAA
ncbi:hypothetical protein ROTAS13_04591 [Roseomonas sp. TAS13]|nr:hypothetical protein ROTAS13_04591 [Roseomonas sp. TAS13]